MSNALHWVWRLLLTAIVAYGVWGIWWQTVQLENLNANIVELLQLLDPEPRALQ
jgi:hypothetical protein